MQGGLSGGPDTTDTGAKLLSILDMSRATHLDTQKILLGVGGKWEPLKIIKRSFIC